MLYEHLLDDKLYLRSVIFSNCFNLHKSLHICPYSAILNSELISFDFDSWVNVLVSQDVTRLADRILIVSTGCGNNTSCSRSSALHVTAERRRAAKAECESQQRPQAVLISGDKEKEMGRK